MNNKFLVLLSVFLLLGAGCNTPASQTASSDTSSSSINVEDVAEFEHEDGTKGKVTYFDDKSLSLAMTFSLADDEEHLDFLGQQVPMAPTLVNVSCEMYQLYVFNRENFGTLADATDAVLDLSAMESLEVLFGDYAAKDIHLMFEDEETGELIAECIADDGEYENMIFSAYREYPENEFTNTQIGERMF